MPPHSFNRHQFRDAVLLLSIAFPALSAASGPGVCDDPNFGSDILRFELSSNPWTSDSSLSSQRGTYLWIGVQYEGGSQKPPGQPYPLVAALSTAYNQTYIATTSTGSKDAPCPNSFSYDENYDPKSWDNKYTFDPSFTCHGYYDLETSAPIYLETSSNFTGSPENALTTAAVKDADVKYGTAYTNLVLPQHYYSSSVKGQIFGSISHYDSFGSNATAGKGAMLGFVDTSEQQVLGLGLNSTFMKYVYESGRTASRSIGLYYGVPAAAGPELERNGTMILGGYSKSRVQGDLLEETYPVGAFKLARQCPWEVEVASMAVSGQEISKSTFTACVEPQEAALVLPQSVYQSLQGSDSPEITITLSNGLKITVPSNLVSFRKETDADKSPILGAPFLSQVYVFADYQTRTLSVGLANNTLAYTEGPDELQCVSHNVTDGDLGWAIGSQAAYEASMTSSSSPSATATGEGKKNGGVRLSTSVGLCMLVATLRLGLLL
ncbi:hypothetical protein ONS95_014625 [Cadophora gregata]|uniref:uncharacterized protein n=1 Tax=Cadophora gregata TaxID=51156 RepID=UPI0026DD6BC1|nr:uncharacterized protein ONS95_014625 [Cadophora gregata]KAK0112906.1 hypothetical protein ONS95_014625 [Cadophora gregata]KAK0125032.1 hypothetical protein ONS96_008898 [Cadophora gregata f. sp. sojae]